MFEDATFHSSNIHPAETQKWMLLALAVNLAAVTAMISLPLLYPDSLPGRILMPTLDAPTPPPSQLPQAHPREVIVRTMQISLNPFIPPTQIPTQIDSTPDAPPISTNPFSATTSDSTVPGATPSTSVFQSTTSRPTVQPAHPSKATISQGVAAGLLLPHAVPAYPPLARAAGISGTVVLAATISTNGTIENLRVLSGSPMLTQAAMETVRTWRYRPYRLNDQPVEVETTINVVFSMGNR